MAHPDFASQTAGLFFPPDGVQTIWLAPRCRTVWGEPVPTYPVVIVCICVIIETTGADMLGAATPYSCFYMASPAALTSM